MCERIRAILGDQAVDEVEQAVLLDLLSEMVAEGTGGLAAAASAAPYVVPERPRVLLVDDDPVIATSTQAVLSQNGFEVRLALTAAAALRVAAEFTPDTLLTDIILPDSNGIRLAQILRAKIQGLRVVFFSGCLDGIEMVQRASQNAGRLVFLPKPLDPRQLLRNLRAA